VKGVVPGKSCIYLKRGRAELNIIFLRGELSLGSAGCAALLLKWCEHTHPPSEAAGAARFTGSERESISKT